jgi:hypothetical protein
MFFRKKGDASAVHAAGYPVNEGMHYLDVLDRTEDILKPDWYLEIGSRSGTSLARRKCNFIGVDPEFHIVRNVFNGAPQMMFMQMTSDAFFDSRILDKLAVRPQMAFIDGMHLFEFALRDFINCERTMDEDGLVFFHDVLPFNAAMTSRQYRPGTPWTGDVWKTILALVECRSDLRIDVIGAAKTGLACVRGLKPGNGSLLADYDRVIARYLSLDIESYGIQTYLSKVSFITPEAFIASLSPRDAS